MFERLLRKFRNRIVKGHYVMTLHAEEEMENNDLSIYDVEAVILSGSILERQKDQKTSEWKYLVRGKTTDGQTAITVVKSGPTGKVVVITVYRGQGERR